MKYIMILDLEKAIPIEDAIYAVITKNTDSQPDGKEVFSEGDMYRIRTNRPTGADAIAFQDDWMYWSSSTGAFFKYVFKD